MVKNIRHSFKIIVFDYKSLSKMSRGGGSKYALLDGSEKKSDETLPDLELVDLIPVLR